MLRRGAILGLMLAALPAQAQQDFIEGVYLRSPAACEKAKGPDGLQSVFEAGETAMTASGIEGIEYHCEFMEVHRSARTLGWRVSALCEEPDHGYPETFVIMRRGEGELAVTAASDLRNEDEDGGNSGMWFHCAGVALP